MARRRPLHWGPNRWCGERERRGASKRDARRPTRNLRRPFCAPEFLGQSAIGRYLLGLHPSPLVAVALCVLKMLLLTVDTRAESPDRARCLPPPGTLGAPHVQSRHKEQEESGGQEVRPDAIVVMQQVGDCRRHADHAQDPTHRPRQQAASRATHPSRASPECRAVADLLATWWSARHDYTSVVCTDAKVRHRSDLGV